MFFIICSDNVNAFGSDQIQLEPVCLATETNTHLVICLYLSSVNNALKTVKTRKFEVLGTRYLFSNYQITIISIISIIDYKEVDKKYNPKLYTLFS